MEQKFIDTNVFVALFNDKDSLHEKAKKALAETARPYLVHEYVVLETATVLMARVNKQTADVFLQGVVENTDFQLVLSTRDSFMGTIKTFLSGKSRLSFTDVALLSLSDQQPVVTFDDTLMKAIKRR